jgi:hypothetical protein
VVAMDAQSELKTAATVGKDTRTMCRLAVHVRCAAFIRNSKRPDVQVPRDI